MAFAKRIAYNVLVSSVSKVLSTILALVSIGFITRYLGKEGFGEYATVLAFLSLFSAISDLGLYSISTREISRKDARQEQIMGNIFTLRFLSSFLVFAIIPFIIFFFPYPERVKQGIFIIAGAFLFSSSYQVLNGIFQKNLAMDKVAIAEFLGKVIQVGTVILAVWLNLSFQWIVTSLLFNMLLIFVLVYFWSRKYIKIKLSFDFAYWKKFLSQSLPMGVAVFITFLYFKLDTILLSILQSSSDVGIYNAAYKVIENISFFPAMIIGLILPVMSRNIFSNKEKFTEISNKTFKVFLVLVVPLIVGALFLSDQIISLIAGEGFGPSAGVLRILIFALAFIFFGNFFNAILISANLQKKLMLALLVAAFFNISSNLFFIPRFSFYGAAYTSVVTELLVVVLTFSLAYKNIGYFPRVKKWWLVFVSGVFMALALFLSIGISNFFVAAVFSSGVYFFFLWIFKIIELQEIKSLFLNKNGKKMA